LNLLIIQATRHIHRAIHLQQQFRIGQSPVCGVLTRSGAAGAPVRFSNVRQRKSGVAAGHFGRGDRLGFVALSEAAGLRTV
jgi:hypothetical protein